MDNAYSQTGYYTQEAERLELSAGNGVLILFAYSLLMLAVGAILWYGVSVGAYPDPAAIVWGTDSRWCSGIFARLYAREF